MNMTLPKIIGSETEYGLMVQNDPEFDSIATSLLLVNSYNTDQMLELLWDYDQEDPLMDARGFELDDDDYDILSPQENMAINRFCRMGRAIMSIMPIPSFVPLNAPMYWT